MGCDMSLGESYYLAPKEDDLIASIRSNVIYLEFIGISGNETQFVRITTLEKLSNSHYRFDGKNHKGETVSGSIVYGEQFDSSADCRDLRVISNPKQVPA